MKFALSFGSSRAGLRGVVCFLVLLYGLATVLLPVFMLNKLVFLPLFLISMCVFVSRPIKIFAPVLVFSIFFYGFWVGGFYDTDSGLARQILLASSSLFLIYVISEFRVDMDYVVKVVGALFALVMCGFSFSLMIAPASYFSQLVLGFYMDNNLGFYGVRDFGGVNMFMLHHRSSPFLLLPLSLFFLDFLNTRKVVSASLVLVVILAIICSASRGLMVMALITLFALYFQRKSWSVRLLMLLALLPMLVFTLHYLVTHTNVLSSTEVSNGTKIGHFVSFFDALDWKMLIFGNGLGSYFYSQGYERLVSQTEITWLDSIRYFGLLLSIVLFVVILFPRSRFLKSLELSSSRLIMFMYLLISLSNPVLFNSFGFFVILWYWSVVMRVEQPFRNLADARRRVE